MKDPKDTTNPVESEKLETRIFGAASVFHGEYPQPEYNNDIFDCYEPDPNSADYDKGQ